VPFEAMHLTEGYFCGIYPTNNQFAITFLIQDVPWVRGELKKHLEDLLVE
jgi:hypothetical protein